MSVIVLFGGDGSEHRVSVASAQNVAHHLPEASYWYWTRDGVVAAVRREHLRACERPFERDFVTEPERQWPGLEAALDERARLDDPAVLFLALHGGSGEDGTVQHMLERRGLGFTGSGSRASRLAFDKLRCRELARELGFRVADGCLVESSSRAHERLAELLNRHAKIVVKPVADGSSHGVRFVEDEASLAELLDTLESDPSTPFLAEGFVTGRELTVGVLDQGSGTRALPCSEVRVASGRSFDFEGKYLGKGAEELTPAPVSEPVAAAVQSLGVALHQGAGCEGYSRTDVIVDDAGPVFLEINTLPGLTAASFIPQQLEAAAVPFRRFLDEQIERARVRAAGTP